MNLNVPIGIEDFAVAQNYYYIDKTLLIKNIIDAYIGKSLLITRPRRFGKSLNLSMVEYFFSNKTDSTSLFKDLSIFKYDDICSEYLNKYPVIRLNYKNINANSYSTLCEQIIDSISILYRKYPEILSSDDLFEIEKNEYIDVTDKKYTDPFQYANSILKLSNYLYKIYKKKVIILIDEYDTPIQSAFDNNYYDEAISFFKSLYSSTLKGNDYMLFSLVTGVLEIGKESLFSGLNNLSVSTISDNKLINYFGFTESEIKNTLKEYDLLYNLDNVNKWYGGYGTNENTIYNPWSILNYLENKSFSYYWVNTSTNSLIHTLFENNKEYVYDKEIFAEFLNNKKLTIDFNPKISYRDINNNIDSFLSFLVQIGYLTAKKIDDQYAVFIPNKEIQYVFKNEVIGKQSTKTLLTIAASLKDAFINGSNDKIKDILENYILTSFSYYDLNNEKSYQLVITSILATLFDEYIVKSEVNNDKGRCDIMILPKNNNNLGIVIELKKYNNKNSKKRLEEYASKALKQIIDKKYYQELKSRELKRIILYGLAFDKYSLEIAYKEL